MSGPGILTIEIATALYAVSCGWTSDKHGSAHLVMSPAAMPAGVQTLDGGSDSFPNSGSGNASGQGGSRGESLPPAAPSGMPTLSCPDVAAWRPSSDCLGTPTTLASSPGALTVLWASEDGIYFGGEGQATSPTSDNGFLDLAPSDGTSIKEVWKGPGIPIGGASIGGTAFLASYGSRNGYVYDLALSPKDPLLSGFWGMGTNFASTAAGQAWYWMEATNDLANLYEADLAGTTRYLGTVGAGADLTSIGSTLYWLAGDVIQAPVASPTTSAVLITVPRTTHLYDMTTDSTDLYIIAGPDIVSVTPSGSSRCVLRLSGPAHLAYRSGQLYIAEPSFGRITAFNIQTHQPACFDSSAGYVDAMAATDRALYWLDRTTHTVRSQSL